MNFLEFFLNNFCISGRTRLEVCGSGVGQNFPLGLPHCVNIGNYPDLHPCSEDVPQHTLVNTRTVLTKTL